MEKLKTIWLYKSDSTNLLFQLMESERNHVKIEVCAIPSKKGRKPQIVKEFFWTTWKSFDKQIKNLKMVIISEDESKNLLSNGL